MSSFTLSTERLRLRVVEPDDAPVLAGLMTAGISRWVAAWPYPLTIPMVEVMVADALAGVAEGRTLPMVMTTKADGAIVGWLKLSKADADAPVAELGYWIGEPFQGRGYAFEAASAMVEAAFRRLGLQAVEAGAQLANAASHNLLRKLGMSEVGERRMFEPARQRHAMILFWRIERGDG